METGLNRTVYNTACMLFGVAFTVLWKLRIAGRENMPKVGPVMVIANHGSLFDPLLVGLASPRYLTTLAKASLFKLPVIGWFSRCVGTMPINRDVGADGLKVGIEALKSGGPLLMFPGGTRSKDGTLGELKPGVAMILKKVPCPVVCVGIDGAFAALPPHRKIPRLSPLWAPVDDATITVSIGKPVEPTEFQGMHRDEVMKVLGRALQRQMDHAHRLRRRGSVV